MDYNNLEKLAQDIPADSSTELYNALLTLVAAGVLPAAMGAGVGAHTGGALGALTGQRGNKAESLGRGVVRGAGAGAGAVTGLTAAGIANNLGEIENPWARLAILGLGGVGGGIGGDRLARKLID